MTRPLLFAALVLTIGIGLGAGIGTSATPVESLAGRVAQRDETISRLRRERNEYRQAFRAQLKGRRKEKRLRQESQQQLRQVVAQRVGSVHHIIEVGAAAYGQSYPTLLRKANCESHLWPYARNRSSGASGLFQFLPSTWRSTPFGRFSIWSPWAQALAASWMHSHLRGGEWACR